MLLGRSRYELTDHPDRVTKIRLGDCQVYEASDNLAEPRRVAYLSGVEAKLDGSIQRSRDRLTVRHPEFEKHTQDIMVLADQYAFGGTDHFDP